MEHIKFPVKVDIALKLTNVLFLVVSIAKCKEIQI